MGGGSEEDETNVVRGRVLLKGLKIGECEEGVFVIAGGWVGGWRWWLRR